MKQIFEYNYHGTGISFKKGNAVMINATEMARSFRKRPSKWLELPSTIKFIDTLQAIRKSDRSFVETANGIGTWMHEDVALEFARWLSPHFAIWCNDKIKELLVNGQTGLGNTDEDQAILQAMNILQNRITKQESRLQRLAPKADYFDDVLQSKSTYTTNQIAKELGMSAISLNKKLNALGIQYKQSETWMLYAKYQDKGLTKTKTYTYAHDTHGNPKTSMQTVWTEKGRLFIHNITSEEYILTNIKPLIQ